MRRASGSRQRAQIDRLVSNASLQPCAGLEKGVSCAYPVEPKPLAVELSADHLKRDAHGRVRALGAPGLGNTPDLVGIKKYLVPVEIKVRGEVLYRTPEVCEHMQGDCSSN